LQPSSSFWLLLLIVWLSIAFVHEIILNSGAFSYLLGRRGRFGSFTVLYQVRSILHPPVRR
jgi:hypothetical protein